MANANYSYRQATHATALARSAGVATLVAFAALTSAPVRAQADWTQCANEGERCEISAPKIVRYGQPWTPAWTAERTMTASFDCNNATFGDPSPGTGKRCEIKDAVTVPPPEPPPNVSMVNWKLSWTHATQNEDGSPLVDRTGYRIEGNLNSGSFAGLVTTSANDTQATLNLSEGTRCFRVVTLSTGGESVPSTQACASKKTGTVPLPPEGVQLLGTVLELVNGATTGLRAVYARTSTGSRGPKIGDMAVGTTTQTSPPFSRVRCSLADSFKYGTITYARVIDPRVPSQYRAGYVSGCVSYGEQ